MLINHWALLWADLQGGWCISHLCQTAYLYSRTLWVVPIWCPSHYRIVLFWLPGFLYVRNVCHAQCRHFYIPASILGPICWVVCSWSKPCLQSGRMVVFNPWSFELFWICFHLGSSLLWLVLVYVLLGSTFQNQDLLENVAWVLIVGVKVNLGPFYIPKRMVSLQYPSLVTLCNWQELYSNICLSWTGLFHTASSMLALSYCEKLPTCHYFLGDMVLKIFCEFQVAAVPGPWDCFWILFHCLTGYIWDTCELVGIHLWM